MAAASGIWQPEFSNFHIEPDGSHVEGEFQVEKHDGHRIRQLVIKRAKKPGRAKTLGREWTLTDDELIAWNQRRVDVMLTLVAKKVDEWEYIRTLLLGTENRRIIEFNRHHDNFWGDCTCLNCYRIGANWLGETYMLLRRWLREGGALYTERTMHTLAIAHASDDWDTNWLPKLR